MKLTVIDSTIPARLLMPFIHIAEGLVQLLTLTLWRPGWPIEFFFHHTRIVREEEVGGEEE